MKKIVLIGDSIRMGYDKYVRAALDGKAEVLFPEEDSRFAEYVLRTVIDWKNNGKWGDDVDVVHWNAGLWDTLTLYEDGTLTPLNVYVDFIKRIHKRLTTLFPKAKLIFATSTLVLEDKYPDHKISVRYNADTRAFNEAAVAVLTELGEEINDLYSLVDGVPTDYYSDCTHLYTPEGTRLIGDRVLEVVCCAAEIEKPSAEVVYEAVKEIVGI